MIRLLTNEEKEGLTDVFNEDFGGSFPPMDANFAAIENEEGEIEGFIIAEAVIRVGCIWAKPELRGTTKAAVNSRKLVEYVHESISPGRSVIVISSDQKFNSLLSKLEMYELDGQVFRKDF